MSHPGLVTAAVAEAVGIRDRSAWFADPAGNVHSVAHVKVAPRTAGGG